MYTEITIHVLLAAFIFNSCIGIWLGLRSTKFSEKAARAEEEIAELKDRINRVGTIEISNW